MTRKILFVFLTLISFQFLFAGTVQKVQGKADALIGGGWKSLKVGDDIPNGTKLMTGINSSIIITNAQSFFTVKELSTLTYYEQITSGGKGSDTTVALDVGKVQVKFNKLKGVDSQFKVQTPRGTAAVRGTEQEVAFFPVSGMKVNVLSGVVSVSDLTGNSVSAEKGEEVNVKQSGEIKAEADVVAEKVSAPKELKEATQIVNESTDSVTQTVEERFDNLEDIKEDEDILKDVKEDMGEEVDYSPNDLDADDPYLDGDDDLEILKSE